MELAAAKTDEMLALAQSRSPADRERLLMGVADLCNGPGQLSPDARALVQDIFMGLVVQAERDIRLRLSEKLSTATWAPPALISILALDDIEIARPLIAKSPMLQDSDLIRLLVEATLEHQIEVARRPNIGAPVVSAIIDQSQPAVLTALAGNTTAQVTPMHLQRLVAASKRIAAMRGPMARHPLLTAELANMLYSWVGEALRADIGERFTIDPAKLGESVSEAVSEAMAGDLPRPSDADTKREQDEMERRLVAKLQAAGQLRPGYLLRSLRERRTGLFEQALATLGEFDVRDIAKTVSANRPDLLALACVSVGIDRSVFPSMLAMVQGLNAGKPSAGPSTTARLADALTAHPSEAAALFRNEVKRI